MRQQPGLCLGERQQALVYSKADRCSWSRAAAARRRAHPPLPHCSHTIHAPSLFLTRPLLHLCPQTRRSSERRPLAFASSLQSRKCSAKERKVTSPPPCLSLALSFLPLTLSPPPLPPAPSPSKLLLALRLTADWPAAKCVIATFPHARLYQSQQNAHTE